MTARSWARSYRLRRTMKPTRRTKLTFRYSKCEISGLGMSCFGPKPYHADGMKRVLYRIFSAALVGGVAYTLLFCHFKGYPYDYGWPAYWYGYEEPPLTRITMGVGGMRIEVPTGKHRIFPVASKPTRHKQFDTNFIISHATWGISTCLVVFSSWRFLTGWLPSICRSSRFSLKALLTATTIIAITTVVMQIRPGEEDFKQAKLLQIEYPTVYVGLDPTATWSPWYNRCLIVFGVVSSLLVVGHGLIRLVCNISGFCARCLTEHKCSNSKAQGQLRSE